MGTPSSKHSIHYSQPRVNLRGINPTEAKAAPCVTISLLCEGERSCDECGERIEGLAAYVTYPRPRLRTGYEVVAITCAECAGHDEEAS